MATIEKSINLNVPARTAYNQWTQFEEFPRFMGGVEEVRQLTTNGRTGARISEVKRKSSILR
jgi:uncharacterized membrane protein